MLRVLLLVLALSLAACTALRIPAAPTPTATPIALSTLRFADAADARQLLALDALARAVSGGRWYHTPYRELGNFIQADWQNVANCRMGTPGCRRIELATLHYTLPDAFGVVFSASATPASGGWTAAISWSERGKTVVGAGYSVLLIRYDASSTPPQEKLIIPLGGTQPLLDDSYGTNVQGLRFTRRIEVTPAAAPLDDLAGYLRSPDQFRAQALEQLAALERAANSALDAAELAGCAPQPVPASGGLPPVCTPRPVTPADVAAVRVAVAAHLAEQRAVVTQDYRAMHAALTAVLPPDTLLAALR